MPPRKPRCSFKDCRDAAQRIVGDCSFCEGHFCGKHRLLESHKCEGLEDVSTPSSLVLSSDGEESPSPLFPDGDGDDFPWWLVGLDEVFEGDEQLADMCLSGAPFAVQEAVARAERRPARGRADPGHQGRIDAPAVATAAARVGPK